MKTVIILLSSLALQQSASAALFPVSPFPAPRAVDAEKCADFSGKWKGKCGDTAEQAFEVKQNGCASLSVGTEYYLIGGSKSTTDTLPVASEGTSTGFTIGTLTTLAWDKSRSQLGFHSSIAVHGLGAAEADVKQIRADGQLKLDGKALVLEAVVAGQKTSCVFDRQ